jgi:hypothetical protein
MPTDYKKEWIEKASIDYFAPFISLWLACNSWYMSHYSDLNDNYPEGKSANDRDFINKIKKDTSSRNHIYSRFAELIDKNDKDGIAFRTDIELLHYALVRANLKPDRIKECSLINAVIDYQNKDNPVNLIKKPKTNKDGSVRAAEADSVIKLDQIFITSDKAQFFAGLFEIIYQVRNMLIHGQLNPNKDEHEVVKYCYRILWELMR